MRKISISKRLRLLAPLIVFSLLSSALAAPLAGEQEKGPYLDRVVFVLEPDDVKALRLVEAGEMQLYMGSLKGEAAKAAKDSPKTETIDAYSGVFNLLVNPVPFREGFNPFAIREVREALNWLIDRGVIVNEILKGFAAEQYTVWQPVSPDYAREIAFMKGLESIYRPNPERAREVIFDALRDAGAEFRGGKWFYRGEPITITFYIRIEDERRQIGDYIAGLLENLGFTVRREYATGAKALQVVYSGEPDAGEWNIYTEGWAFTAITAYDDALPEFMYTSPGSGRVFAVYEPPEELKEAALKLSSAKYLSLEERGELVRKVTELGIKESVRIWLVSQVTVFPHSSEVSNVAFDLIGGTFSLFTLRTAKLEGKVGGEIKVGQRSLFVSAWNTAPGEAGFTWIYDALIRYAVTDPGVWPHPHTGRYLPVRAEFEVETAGPEGKLDVPADAIKWDVVRQRWLEVGEGERAMSKVTFKYTMGKWHHGEPVTTADLLSSVAVAIEVINPSSELYDPNVENPSLRTFVDKLVGIRVVSEDTIEVYVDYWHPDESFIAAMADIWEDTPWELQALMNWVYMGGEAAFSEPKARELGVEQIDLSKGPTIPILAAALKELRDANYVPPYLRGWVSEEEAASRWDSLAAWYEEMGHFFVSNGPFYVEVVDPGAMQIIIKAFRDYPYHPGKWDDLVTPRVPEIILDLTPIVIVGEPALFLIRSTLDGAPYTDVKISYMVIDPLTGAILVSGESESLGAGTFAVKLDSQLTSRLSPGTYEMIVVGVGGEAALPRVSSTAFTVLPSIKGIEERVGELEERVGERLEEIERRVEAISDSLAEAIKDLGQTVGRSLEELVEETREAASREDVTSLERRVTALSYEVAEIRGYLSILQIMLLVVIALSVISIGFSYRRR